MIEVLHTWYLFKDSISMSDLNAPICLATLFQNPAGAVCLIYYNIVNMHIIYKDFSLVSNLNSWLKSGLSD